MLALSHERATVVKSTWFCKESKQAVTDISSTSCRRHPCLEIPVKLRIVMAQNYPENRRSSCSSTRRLSATETHLAVSEISKPTLQLFANFCGIIAVHQLVAFAKPGRKREKKQKPLAFHYDPLCVLWMAGWPEIRLSDQSDKIISAAFFNLTNPTKKGCSSGRSLSYSRSLAVIVSCL